MGYSGKGANEFQFSNCFPEGWWNPDTRQLPEEAATPQAYAAPGAKSYFTQVLDGVQTVVDFVCKFSEYLSSMLSRRMRRFMRRQKYRMFAETRVVRYSKAQGWFSDGVDTVMEWIDSGVNWVQARWEDVKGIGSRIINNVKDLWQQFMVKVRAFLGNEFINNAITMVNCFLGVYNAGSAIYDMIVGMINRVLSLAKIVAGDFLELASFFIDLICNLGEFREAYQALASGLEEGNQNKKYEFYGTFIGKLLKIFGKSKKLRKLRKH
jgi:hypothetical protein